MARRAKADLTTTPTMATTTAPSPQAASGTAAGIQAAEVQGAGGTVRRARRGLKRTRFQVPQRVPVPVRALWQAASEEERRKAHAVATTVLKTWLGKMSREEAAKELSMTGLRFWQLSQQAVAGLVAGCLRQPRFRGRVDLGGGEEVPVASLKRRVATLEREVEAGRRLIDLLRELPGHRGTSTPAEKEVRRARKTGPAVAAGADAGGGRAAGGDAQG